MKALDPIIAESLKPRWLPGTLAYEMVRVPDGTHEIIVLLTMRPTIHGLRGARYTMVTQIGMDWAICPWIGGPLLAALHELPPPSPDLLTPELREAVLKVPPIVLADSFRQLDIRADHVVRGLHDARERVNQMINSTASEL